MNEVLMHLKYGSVVTLLTVGIGVFALRPAMVEQASARSEIHRLQSRLSKADEDREGRKKASERLARLQYSLSHDTKPIPDSSDIATLINGISGFIRDLNLHDQKLDRGKETVIGNTSSTGLDVETRGDFSSVVELLAKIEALPRLVRISSLRLSGLDRNTGTVKATIGLEAFYKVVDNSQQSTNSSKSTDSGAVKGM